MSIIIENKEDIELLLEFFKLFDNSDKIEAQEDDDLRERVNQIDKWKLEQADAKKNFAKELLAVKSELKEIKEELTNVAHITINTTVEEEDDDVPAQVTYRKYGQKIRDNLPQIKSLENDGHFILGRNKKSVYTIEDVLRLKPLIPQLKVNYNEMGHLIGVSDFTARVICCSIENGIFDKWFKEWEQIQANNYYGKLIRNSIVNNPQKRKENGMV